MDNMITLGFITSGLAALALWRLLSAFRELRAEVLAQRSQLLEMADTAAAAVAAAQEAATVMPEFRRLAQRVEQAEKRARSPRYEEAARLLRGGSGEARLTSACGLSRGEAELMRSLCARDPVSGEPKTTN
ncbi:MAG: DUF2802 domain-containing protein [Gammaproteobacteria bacterium]|jgi:hypothetical protein